MWTRMVVRRDVASSETRGRVCCPSSWSCSPGEAARLRECTRRRRQRHGSLDASRCPSSCSCSPGRPREVASSERRLWTRPAARLRASAALGVGGWGQRRDARALLAVWQRRTEPGGSEQRDGSVDASAARLRGLAAPGRRLVCVSAHGRGEMVGWAGARRVRSRVYGRASLLWSAHSGRGEPWREEADGERRRMARGGIWTPLPARARAGSAPGRGGTRVIARVSWVVFGAWRCKSNEMRRWMHLETLAGQEDAVVVGDLGHGALEAPRVRVY